MSNHHRIVFVANPNPTPIDLIRTRLDATETHSTEDDQAQARAREALFRIALCVTELVSICEQECSDTQKIALIEAQLIKLFL